MIYKTQFRLILSFLSVTLLVGMLSLLAGVRIINSSLLTEASNRISLDLNAAREIYLNQQEKITLILKLTTLDNEFRDALAGGNNRHLLRDRLNEVASYTDLDFAGIVTSEGLTVCGIGDDPEAMPSDINTNPLVKKALADKTTAAGTVILTSSYLQYESPELAGRARIDILPTLRADPEEKTVETSALAIACAVPVFKGNILIGAIYGGVLLNRSTFLVDKIKNTLFRNETFKGKSIGTATIFFGDLRISTNVLGEDGQRAIGTRVSREVRKKVLDQGEIWTDRAFVVNDWYLTAYEPILDIYGERVGMLYVGVLEEKYRVMMNRAVSFFMLITIGGISVALVLSYFLGRRLLKPVNELIELSSKVSKGDLSGEILHISGNELGLLQITFREMLESLRERERQQKMLNDTKLLQSEKQASVGRLAAGVAHEINNPLTGVLTFTHMLLKRKDIDEDMRSDLETIAQATERVREIVKGLLDFSRQTKIEPVSTDINEIIQSSITLVSNQAMVRGVILCFDPQENLPYRTLDSSQFQSVIINMLLNAIDACETGGHINVTTSLSVSTGKDEFKGIEINIADTGCGIPEENLGRLFDPFFTTKEVGRGTGLGLAVSYGIIERHGGTIHVKSKLGRGTTFIIWLPLSEG